MDTRHSEAVIARLHQMHPKVIDLSLERLTRLLDKLGNPQDKLPPVFHIAGTNGKGSTVAMLRAVLEAAGYSVHAYTSPHLVRFHERIRLRGQLIGEEALTKLLERVEEVANGQPITFFEVTTAAAFLAFSEVAADVVVLETGLGGRLDATNMVPHPLAAIITPVSLDHQHFLGETLAEIAGEKAGIIKKTVPVILSRQAPDSLGVIEVRAKRLEAPVFAQGRDWSVKKVGQGKFRYTDQAGSLDLPVPSLKGKHQLMNAGTAIAALRHQTHLKIPPAAFRAGLGWVRWPARLQKLEAERFGVSLPAGSQIWLDGGHNPAAASIIRDFLRSEQSEETPLYLILGMMSRKDVAGFMRPLAGLGAKIFGVAIEGHSDGAFSAADVAAAATDAGMNGRVARDVTGALEAIAAECGESSKVPSRPPLILIGGSLYLAGNVLRDIGEYPD